MLTTGDGGRDGVGLLLVWVARFADAALELHAIALLNYVCELVGQQFAARQRLRRVIACAEHHILPGGKRSGREGVRSLRRLIIAMHAHLAEVMPEAWLHERAHGGRQRLPAPAQRSDLRSRLRTYAGCVARLLFRLNPLFFFTLRTRRPRGASSTLALDRR